MAIPKEPRQLMINIMYLVLMALLALNVSAEVMNAFITLDEGNQDSIAVVDSQMDKTTRELKELVQDPAKQKFQPLIPAVDAIQSEVASFNAYVASIRDRLIDESGNNNGDVDDDDYIEKKGVPVLKGLKNKDVTTRVLVNGENGEAPIGDQLKDRIEQTRNRLIEIYSNLLNEEGTNMDLSEENIQTSIASVAQNMPFSVDDETWKASDKDSWSEFKFGHMPVAAVLPLLSQFQSDLKVSEANMVNSLRQIAGGKTIEFDEFFPVFNADRSYVISGESINAEVSVGSYSSTLDPSNVRLFVGGQRVNIGANGKAQYNIRGSRPGQNTINTRVEVTNPLTGETKTGTGTFTYEVGQRSVAVSADKMNVFYIGVQNPITISAAGVSSNDVRVNVSGANISGSGSNRVVTASRPGDATVSVTANGQTLGSFPFRVKRIPDPVPKVGGNRGGNMPANVFKAQRGLYVELENFDFEAKCDVAGYQLVYVPKRADAVPSTNQGGNFNATSRQLVDRARPGDVFYMNNIRARCPGDDVTRDLGSMAFQIQ